MSDKIKKETVLYVFNPPTRYTCSECAFLDNGECTDYVEDDDDVKPYGSCNDWQSSAKGHIKGNKQRTRKQTGYAENEAGFSCKRCEEFIPETKLCKKIDETGGLTPGRIDPDACCNRWEYSDLRGDKSDTEFKSYRWYNKNR